MEVRRGWASSLQARLVGVLALAVLVAAVVLTYQGSTAASEARTDAAQKDLSLDAVTAAFEVEAAVGGLPDVLRTLREVPAVQGYLRTNHVEDGVDPVDGNSTSLMWQGRLATIMAGYMRANPSYRWLQFATADGVVAAEATSDGDTVAVSPIVDLGPVAKPDLLADAVALDPSEAVSAPIAGSGSGDRLFWVAIPVEAADNGEVEAALLIAVTVEPLLASISEDVAVDGATTVLAADDGRLLAAPAEQSGTDLADLFGDDVAALIEGNESDVIVDGDLQIAWVTARPVPEQPSSYVSIVRSVDAQVVTAAARQFRNASILIALGVLALSVLPAIWLIHRSVVKPLQAITQQAREMADGDLSRTLKPVGRSDEIGELNAAFRSMADSQRTVVRQLETACGGLEGASGDMSALADTMASGAGAASERASSAARTTAEVSTSISSVAASLGEMRDSIRAVANSTAEASSIASEGVEAMDLTAETVQKLGQSSAEISDVLDLINDIAEQVNLLALNATIEAARVGEAGKGFAVVANEVKELATRTSVATEQIAERIGRIRTDTESAVKATTEVRQTIGRVDDISAIIAASVEQQSATSQQISGKVARVSEAAGEIAEVVNDTASDTDVTKQNTDQLTASARDLQDISAELRGLLGRYTVAPADPPTSVPAEDTQAGDLVGGRR